MSKLNPISTPCPCGAATARFVPCFAFHAAAPLRPCNRILPVLSPRPSNRFLFRPCRRRASHLSFRNTTRATAAPPTSADPASEDVNPSPSADDGDAAAADAADAADGADAASGVQGAVDALAEMMNASFDYYIWPWMRSCSVLRKQWDRSGGNFILRPPVRAKAVLHFVGGAFVGAAPHIAYSTLLSRLAARGYCVVATPFDLSLDYLETTAAIVEKWEAVETGLALDYGPIPVIGVGHSAGALFHSIASSLFDDVSPKAALLLISYNNKPIKSAIPAYDLLVTPAAKQAMSLDQILPENIREMLETLPGTIDAAVEGSPFAPARVKDSILPLVKDSRRVVEQFPPLVTELAGAPRPREPPLPDLATDGPPRRTHSQFYPPPDDISAAIANMYSTEQTLVVKFNSDVIDESEVILGNVRRRGHPIEVSMMELDGNHLTPLMQVPDPLDPDAAGADVDLGPLGVLVSGAREALSAFSSRELFNLESLIDEWVDATILSDQ